MKKEMTLEQLYASVQGYIVKGVKTGEVALLILGVADKLEETVDATERLGYYRGLFTLTLQLSSWAGARAAGLKASALLRVALAEAERAGETEGALYVLRDALATSRARQDEEPFGPAHNPLVSEAEQDSDRTRKHLQRVAESLQQVGRDIEERIAATERTIAQNDAAAQRRALLASIHCPVECLYEHRDKWFKLIELLDELGIVTVKQAEPPWQWNRTLAVGGLLFRTVRSLGWLDVGAKTGIPGFFNQYFQRPSEKTVNPATIRSSMHQDASLRDRQRVRTILQRLGVDKRKIEDALLRRL